MDKKIFTAFSLMFFLFSFHPLLQAKEDLVKKARESMDIMSYQQAVRLLEQAISEGPKKTEVRLDLAFAYYKLGRTDEAIKILKQELALFPKSCNALILLGYLYFNQGDCGQAANVCRDFDDICRGIRLEKGENNPNFGLPYFILGYYEKANGDLDKANKDFRRALERGYDPIACHAQLIDMELNKEDWKEGLKRSEEAREVEGSRPEFSFLMGYCYYQLGETEKAVSCFEGALRLKPYLVEAVRNLYRIHVFRGEFQKAAPLLRKTLLFFPYDSEARTLLEKARAERQIRMEGSRPELTKNIVDSAEPEYKYIFAENIDYVIWRVSEYAMGLVRSGELGVARNWLRRFLDLFDRSPELNYNLAKLYEQQNNLGEALRYAWRARELKKDYRDAYDLVGSIFFKMQDFANSLRSYLAALELNPSDAMAYYNLGCAYFAMEDLGSAEEHWKNAIQYEEDVKKEEEKAESPKDELKISVTVRVKPISFESRRSLSRLYLQLGRKEEALAELEKGAELRPNDADIYYEMGRIYLDLGESEKADSSFARYISLGGDEARVKTIREKER